MLLFAGIEVLLSALRGRRASPPALEIVALIIMDDVLQTEIRCFGAFDSTRCHPEWGKAARRVLAATIHAPNGTIQKKL